MAERTSTKTYEKRTPRAPRRRTCFFDEMKLEPQASDVVTLRRFMSERGKIVPAAKSGVCAQHQRKLTRAIKQGRQLGLLPFSER